MAGKNTKRGPFRADQVGSLLRTPRIKKAREEWQRGQLTADALRAVEDEEIGRIVREQQAIGLKAVTDGEFRRSWWHFDFLENLDGVEGYYAEQGIQFHEVQTPSKGIRVVGPIGFSRHPMLEHFRYLQSIAGDRVPKMTIPSPSMLHFRGTLNSTVYPDQAQFFHDLAQAYQQAIRAFYEAGCRYLQLDDTAWAYLCDQEQRAALQQKGWDPEELKRIYADTLKAALADRPEDMTVTMHICRGNFRSTWIASGGYEPVADVLFGEVPVDGFFLEYDSERAGGFEPLRHINRPDLTVVLGLITSKVGALEPSDEVKRRIDEASRYVPLDQLALSPQCGFASTEDGNLLTEDEQWAKLRHVVAIAEDVWGAVDA